MSRVNGGENASIRNALLYAIKAYCVNMAADTKNRLRLILVTDARACLTAASEGILYCRE